MREVFSLQLRESRIGEQFGRAPWKARGMVFQVRSGGDAEHKANSDGC